MMATAFVVAVIVYSCSGGKLGTAETLDLSTIPSQSVRDMYIVQSDNGILKTRLEAPLMERYEKDTVSYEQFPQGVTAYSYNESGQLESIITADNARHSKSKKDNQETWSAFGNVVINNVVNHETMETDTIYWNATKERIYTDCYVRMYSPDGFMQGYGMESDQKARNSVILKPFNSYGVVVKDSTAVLIDSINFIGPVQKK